MSTTATSDRDTPLLNGAGQSFGAWLITQKDRDDFIGQLAAGAAADRRFPRSGDPGAVRSHLNQMQADGDMFAALDDAEVDWLAY